MAKVMRNMILAGLSGSLGPDHYARITKDGRTIISAKPDFGNRQFSEAQLNQQRRMKAAAAYAKVAKETHPIYAKLAQGKARNAYNIALGDWLNPPAVRSINWHEEKIRVSASDDVMVTGVTVTVLDAAGQPLEQGEAQLVLGVWWEYKAANRGPIRVEARDLAGNVTRREFDDPSLARFPGKTA